MVKDIIEEIFPPDVPRIVRWRLMVAGAMGLMVLHVAWACGLIPGFPGFAQAGEIDQKLEPVYAQLGALATEQAKQGEKIEKANDLSERILINQLASDMRDLQKIRCGSKDSQTRERLAAQLEDAQQEYYVLTKGQRYPIPPCNDL